jgi:hypothetical protein
MQGLLLALEKKLEGEVAVAKANIEVYISQSVGIGEHPDLVTLQKHFLLPEEFSVKIYDNPIEV